MPFLILLVAFFISSCGPKYKVVKSYIPPKDEACVEKCKLRLAECKNRCFENYRKCLKESTERAKKIYEALYEDYQRSLQDYHFQYREYLFTLERFKRIERSLKEDYEFYNRICTKYKDREACRRRNYLKRFLRNLSYEKPLKPLKPVKPKYQRILSKERKTCSCDCGCMQDYDVCFQSCGGRIETKRICVEDCDR